MFLDDVDVRYRALVDVAGALTSHSDHTDLLRSLRGHLEPIVQFTFLSVWLWDREADRLTVAFVEPAETPGRPAGRRIATRPRARIPARPCRPAIPSTCRRWIPAVHFRARC